MNPVRLRWLRWEASLHLTISRTFPIKEVQEKLGVKLPTEEYDTYGGYICGIIDRIPNDGEAFECEAGGLQIAVHSVKNHRIGDTQVSLIKLEDGDALQ